MTCDEVFDVLTRGPFPTGHADDERVERHLTACAECRRLAEALRPAIELLQESIHAEESGDLPGYRGQMAWSHDTPFEYEAVGSVAQATLTAPSSLRAIPLPSANILRFAAAVLIGIVAAAGWHGLTNSRHESTPPTTAGVLPLALPAVCRNASLTDEPSHAGTDVVGQLAARSAVAINDLTCCTDCHSSAIGPRLSVEARAIVARACLACH